MLFPDYFYSKHYGSNIESAYILYNILSYLGKEHFYKVKTPPRHYKTMLFVDLCLLKNNSDS